MSIIWGISKLQEEPLAEITPCVSWPCAGSLYLLHYLPCRRTWTGMSCFHFRTGAWDGWGICLGFQNQCGSTRQLDSQSSVTTQNETSGSYPQVWRRTCCQRNWDASLWYCQTRFSESLVKSSPIFQTRGLECWGETRKWSLGLHGPGYYRTAGLARRKSGHLWGTRTGLSGSTSLLQRGSSKCPWAMASYYSQRLWSNLLSMPCLAVKHLLTEEQFLCGPWKKGPDHFTVGLEMLHHSVQGQAIMWLLFKYHEYPGHLLLIS